MQKAKGDLFTDAAVVINFAGDAAARAEENIFAIERDDGLPE